MSGPLNADEVSALMSAIQSGRVSPDQAGATRKPVVPYDLTSQDRIIRGQMPTLDAINEQTAAALGIGLAGRTRLALRVTAGPASLMKFLDLNSVLAPPIASWVLSLGLGHGHAMVVMEPALATALLNAALGDRKPQNTAAEQAQKGDGEHRDLTPVEQLVLRRLLAILTDAMTKAWEPVMPFRPEVVRFESDTRMTNVAPGNEVAIVCPFEITGGLEGRVQLIIPYAVVEPAKQKLSSPPRVAATADRRFSATLSHELNHVKVQLRGILGKTKLTLQSFLALQVGDVVSLDSDEGAALPVVVQGQVKFLGMPRVCAGSMALEITEGPFAPQGGQPGHKPAPVPAPDLKPPQPAAVHPFPAARAAAG